MGLLDKIFGGEPDYPPIPAESPVTEKVQSIEQPLKTLMDKVSDRMEIIPADDRTIIFIGKPPKKFGIAWIEQNEVVNFQALAQEKGIGQKEMLKVSEQLGQAYENNEPAERFTTNVAGRDVVVSIAPALKQEVSQIISNVIN